MPTLIIVTIYVLICAKTVLDKKQIEKTRCVHIFANQTHIKQDIKKLGTIQKQLDVLKLVLNAHGKCELVEIMSGLLLEYKAPISLPVLVDMQLISQDIAIYNVRPKPEFQKSTY